MSGNLLKLLTNAIATVKKDHLNLTFRLTVMRSPKHAHKNRNVFLLIRVKIIQFGYNSRKATRWVWRWAYFVVCCFLRSTFGKKSNLSKKNKTKQKNKSCFLLPSICLILSFSSCTCLYLTAHYISINVLSFIYTFSFVNTE